MLSVGGGGGGGGQAHGATGILAIDVMMTSLDRLCMCHVRLVAGGRPDDITCVAMRLSEKHTPVARTLTYPTTL